MCEKCPYSELFWSVYFGIRIPNFSIFAYGEILNISPYSVWMRENTEQNNLECGHFLHSVNQSNM